MHKILMLLTVLDLILKMLCKDNIAQNSMKDRLHDIREVLLEDTQLDLYQILNDDSDWMKERVQNL